MSLEYSQTVPRRGSSQSTPYQSLLLKKPPNLNKKCWPPPNLVPKKKVLFISIRITSTLDVQIVWIVCQKAVWVTKRHTNASFWCSQNQRVNFGCLLFNLWIYLPTLKPYSTLCMLCGLRHLSWFQGLKYIPPSFWSRGTKRDV